MTAARQIERVGDMGEGLKLSLYLDDDGDPNISIIPVGQRYRKSVEFCTSGTQSPKTVKALHNLFKAMLEDAETIPQVL